MTGRSVRPRSGAAGVGALAAARADTAGLQAAAADPAASAWVSANAGTGKTHVLTRRVLRILMAGTAPERILCLTYTKAAAAEMAKRVFDALGEWVIAAEEQLAGRLADLIGRPATVEETARARQLFTRAIETPGGLKVQTIHSFCERLLQRFPIEAGVSPHFTILDDATGAELRREAIDAMLGEATRDAGAPLGRALAFTVAYAQEHGFDELIASALGELDRIEVMLRAAGPRGADDFAGVEAELREALGIPAGATSDSIAPALADVLAAADLARAVAVLAEGSTNDQKLSACLARAKSNAPLGQRIAAMEEAFLTKTKEARSDRFVTKRIQEAHPDLYARLVRARDRTAELVAERQALLVVEATLALVRLADAVAQRYAAAKAARGALDFDDLIRRTGNLLAASEAAEWVLYKLDGGLDHILVDESQDTAPVQWRIVESLAGEFFAGAGARDGVRTLFAVGDEKQSIYSFQGAAPRMFAAMGRKFAALAERSGRTWRSLPLTLSFRTVAPLLEAVDRVFADRAAAPGLTAEAAEIRHIAHRDGEAGRIEVWPVELPDDAVEADPWRPLEEEGAGSPVLRLANRIAATIRGWLDAGELLASAGRPIRAGDVIILVRKRRPFAGPMVSALKAAGIPVAGADRIELLDQIAVQDLVALGAFLTLPEDDLSLASVLKSPLFDLDDDDLFAIAHGRRGTLWSALLRKAEAEPRFAPAAETLKRWRSRADFMPPFEFYAGLLDERIGGQTCRQRMLARLGPEAADPIDELVSHALAYDDRAPPSLQGFLHWLGQGRHEIKRDMDQGRDEVRVMTVHGAKGLEAPIVFLPDTCTIEGAGRGGGVLPLLGAPARNPGGEPIVWPVKGCGNVAAVRTARDLKTALAREEYYRLLYVAMTRPRDRLYVAGFRTSERGVQGCWYDLIWNALQGDVAKVALADGREVWRLESRQEKILPAAAAASNPPVTPAAKLPDWALAPAAREHVRTIPLVPSRLAPVADESATEALDPPPDEPEPDPAAPSLPRPRRSPAATLAEPPAASPLELADDARFLRGTLTHALLEHLPAIDPQRREAVARAFLERRAPALSTRVRSAIVRETLVLMGSAAFAPLFSVDSRAEVPIVAEIAPPSGTGPPLRITGRLDRLALVGGEALIVDYKTNRPPPREVAGVPRAYVLQLAAYRLAIAKIFDTHAVRAAIVWTDGPRLMAIPPAMLDEVEPELWRL